MFRGEGMADDAVADSAAAPARSPQRSGCPPVLGLVVPTRNEAGTVSQLMARIDAVVEGLLVLRLSNEPWTRLHKANSCA